MKKKLTEAEIARRKRKKKIRKRRLTLLFVLLLGVAIIALFVLLKTRLFPIKNISAKGSQVYESSQIIKASGIKSGTPIMSFSNSKISNRISEKLPYVDTVKINRTLPDTVALIVSDAKDYFLFTLEGKHYAVSKKYKVLSVCDEAPEGLIEVSAKNVELNVGKEVVFKKNQTKELFELITTYLEEKKISINAIDLTNTSHITIKVEDKFEVNLGNKANLEEKINHLAGMIPEIGDRKGKINLDMWSKSDSKGTFIAEN